MSEEQSYLDVSCGEDVRTYVAMVNLHSYDIILTYTNKLVIFKL